MPIALLVAVAHGAPPEEVASPALVDRGPVPTLLMAHPDVTESSKIPHIPRRDQPHRIYERIDGETYEGRCRGLHDTLGDRFSRIRYRSSDGVFVEGIVVVPPGFDPAQTYPTLVFNRGNWGEGRRFTWCFARSYDAWARAGFVVFSTQYRGVAGGEGRDMWGGDDLADVLSMVDIARDYAFTDDDDVFMYGASRGGMMTYMALAQGAAVKAAVVDCGVADARVLSDDLVARLYPPSERAAQYERRSAVLWPEKLNVPLRVIHGGKDPGVPVRDVRTLARALGERGQPVELVVYPEAGHCGENYPDDWFADTLQWLQAHRKGSE